jgi:hypothetical protein
MRPRVYESIDDIGCDRITELRPGLDFSFGLLRAMERSLWGELIVRYLVVENDDGLLLAFTPVYIGSNLNCNALLPKAVQKGYDAIVGGLGMSMATRVAITGSLISDRGWIPMHRELQERAGALKLLLKDLDRLAKEHHAQLGMLKDIHRDFPKEDRAVFESCGFAGGFSLPTIRIDTSHASFEEYLEKQLTKNGRKHARKQFHKADGTYTMRVIEDFEEMIPKVYGLHRTIFLRANYQFEDLPPRFFVECARSATPKTELVVCERNDGRLVGSLMIFYDEHEQQNKRIGIDYDNPDSGLVYNLLNYTGIQRAIARRIPTLWMGQSSYIPKMRMGGQLEDQYLFIKAYDPILKPSLPLQRWWMARYSAARVAAGVEQGTSI